MFRLESFCTSNREFKNKPCMCHVIRFMDFLHVLVDLTMSKRPGTAYQIEIRFAVVNHLYIFCFPL